MDTRASMCVLCCLVSVFGLDIKDSFMFLSFALIILSSSHVSILSSGLRQTSCCLLVVIQVCSPRRGQRSEGADVTILTALGRGLNLGCVCVFWASQDV